MRSWLKVGSHRKSACSEEGENGRANEEAGSSPALYNSVSQGLSDATTECLQQGELSEDYRLCFRTCVSRAHTSNFLLLYRLFPYFFTHSKITKANPAVDFVIVVVVFSGGLLSA